MKESRKQSEGTGIRTLSPLRRFRQGPSYSPDRVVSQSATLNKECSAQGCKRAKHKTYIFSMIAGSYCRRRRRFTILESDEMKFASPLQLTDWKHER